MADDLDGMSARSRRLESWKEIATYLGRDVRTVQRWERRDGLPIHRLQHGKLGSVFAHTCELDTWREARDPTQVAVRSEVANATPFRQRTVWTGAAISAVALALVFGFSRLGPADSRAIADSRVRSLAVLPLGDFSQHGDQGYFADGMTEALIGRLSTLRDLRVIARTSVMQFKNTRKPVPEIGEALKVDAVVEGSVTRSGDHVRITAQLVRAASGETLWSGSYERELRNVLNLQGEVAEAIASQIMASVTPAERARVGTARAVAPAVYESYLKGLWHLTLEPRNVEASIRHFEATTAADPTFAPAYVGLAASYRALGSTGEGVLPVSEAHANTIAAATKAIALDPHLSGAHTMLAFAYQEEWRWIKAEETYRRAIEINPNDAETHAGIAELLLWRGRTDEGLAYSRRARELDPLSVRRTVQLGFLLYHARQYDEAIRELKTVLAAAPNHSGALWFLGFALIDSSRSDEAIQTLERLVVIRDRHPAALGLLARAYGRAGRRADALGIIDELKQRERSDYVPPAPFVHAYIGLGDRERAFTSLERSYRERSHIVQMLKTHPLYDPLRDDRRFAELVRRVGLE